MNAITQINEIKYQVEQLLLLFSIVLFSGLCILYVYFLSNSVVHVVISKESEANIYKANSEIAALEAEYMRIQNSLSQEIVEQSGYIATNKKIFIDRTNPNLVTQR